MTPTPEEVLGVKRLPLVLTAGQVARLLGVSAPTVYRWMEEGVVPCLRLGGVRRVPTRWLTELLEQPPSDSVA